MSASMLAVSATTMTPASAPATISKRRRWRLTGHREQTPHGECHPEARGESGGGCLRVAVGRALGITVVEA